MVDKRIKEDERRTMYIGDTYIKHGLFHGRVYINGLPKTFDRFLKEVPLFKNLLVPVDGISEKLEEIKKKDSVLYHSNQQLKEYLRGEK